MESKMIPFFDAVDGSLGRKKINTLHRGSVDVFGLCIHVI